MHKQLHPAPCTLRLLHGHAPHAGGLIHTFLSAACCCGTWWDTLSWESGHPITVYRIPYHTQRDSRPTRAGFRQPNSSGHQKDSHRVHFPIPVPQCGTAAICIQRLVLVGLWQHGAQTVRKDGATEAHTTGRKTFRAEQPPAPPSPLLLNTLPPHTSPYHARQTLTPLHTLNLSPFSNTLPPLPVTRHPPLSPATPD